MGNVGRASIITVMSMFRVARDEGGQADADSGALQEGPRRRSVMRLNLARGADGRIRPAARTDIGDIWAEQQRIRLREAICEDRKRAEKKQRPRRQIAVTLRLPKLPKRLRMPFKSTRKRLWIAGAALALLIASFGLYPSRSTGTEPVSEPKKKVASERIAKDERPSYVTVLPKDRSIEDLGGWARVSPQDKEPVFAFADKLGDVPVTVSQQPLPASFKDDTAGKIADLAKQFNAQEKITAGSTTVYIGTSIKGPQSVVFTKQNLLILIKSSAKVENHRWIGYIEELQ